MIVVSRFLDHSLYIFILTRIKRIVVVDNGLVEWVVNNAKDLIVWTYMCMYDVKIVKSINPPN